MRYTIRKHAYTHYGHAYGDICGDDLRWCLTINNDIIVNAHYMAKACSLTTAVADLLAERIIGLTIDRVKIYDPFQLIDFKISPGRHACIALPKEALDEALHF